MPPGATRLLLRCPLHVYFRRDPSRRHRRAGARGRRRAFGRARRLPVRLAREGRRARRHFLRHRPRSTDGVGSLPLADLQAFTADPRMVATAGDSYLRRALEALLDLGRHVLAKGFGRAPCRVRPLRARGGMSLILSCGPSSATPAFRPRWGRRSPVSLPCVLSDDKRCARGQRGLPPSVGRFDRADPGLCRPARTSLCETARSSGAQA